MPATLAGRGRSRFEDGTTLLEMNKRHAVQRAEVRRIYHDDGIDDGRYRVLVDRLWPRGLKKDDAVFNEWLKDVAPSTGLRRWYGHDPQRFDEFTLRYRAELEEPPAREAIDRLVDLAADRGLILLTATADVAHSGARVLCDVLLSEGRT